MNQGKLYSIGYATKPIATFIAQLEQHEISVVADVRSVPYSNAFFDYHQEALVRHLRGAGIRYVYMGAELGPRSKDPSHYDQHNQVQFVSLMSSKPFLSGLERLKNGLEKGFKVALMCAEKDPAVCHRSLLIAYQWDRLLNTDTAHITHEGELEYQSELEVRLMELTKTQPDMLMSEEDARHLAYQRQCQCCAYVKPSD